MKARYVVISVIIIAVIGLLIFNYRQRTKPSGMGTVNEDIIQIKGFSVSSESTDKNTSATGTVFVKGVDGIPEHIQIVAYIEIDADDWSGVSFYISDKWYISSIVSSYPEGKAQSSPANYVSRWIGAASRYELNRWIKVVDDSNPTERGTGSVVINIYPDKSVLEQLTTFDMKVAVGSEERDGIKIAGTDYITLEIPFV